MHFLLVSLLRLTLQELYALNEFANLKVPFLWSGSNVDGFPIKAIPFIGLLIAIEV